MVHRAILGSFERFVGVLIEHYGGRFPFWLAPTQVALIPIREEHATYWRTSSRSSGEFARALVDPGHMKSKIKQAEHEKIPFMLIAGDREAAEGTVTVRRRQTQGDPAFERFPELARRPVRALARTRLK